MSAIGPYQTSPSARHMSAFGAKADVKTVTAPSANPGTTRRALIVPIVLTANLMGGRAGPSDRGKRHSPITARMNSKTMKRRAARGISESNSMARRRAPTQSGVEIRRGRFWPLCWPSLKGVICSSKNKCAGCFAYVCLAHHILNSHTKSPRLALARQSIVISPHGPRFRSDHRG
jgi:hypothetical protein